MSAAIIDAAIEDIRIVDRHRKSIGDVSDLAKSIEAIGLLHPVVLTKHYRLVAGERRIAAYKHLGRETIPAVIASSLNEAREFIIAERDENTCRKDFTPSEAVALGKVLEEIESEAAKERRLDGNARGGKSNAKEVKDNLSPTFAKQGMTREIVGEAIGMSGTTYQRAKAVVDAAEQSPEEYGHLVDEMDRTGKVSPAYNKLPSQNGHRKQVDTPVDDCDSAVSLTKAEEESRRIIAEFHARLEKVSTGIYTLESLAIALDCHQKGSVEFVRMCEVSPHVEVVRTYGRKGLTQYQFLKTNCVSAADRIRQLAERIATDPSGNSRVHADATRILQLLGG